MTTTALDDYAEVSDPSGEPVAIWERVSTDMSRQDIASQTRDLVAFIGAGSYRVERVFRFEASAFHGGHAGQQAEMIADIAAGRYKTVVSAMTSRYERRGWQHAMYFGLMLHIEYGARIVCAVCDRSGCRESSHAGSKHLVPHAVAAELVTQAFIDSAEGTSTPKIARTFHKR